MKFLWVSVVVAICVSACSNLQDKKISVPDENETRFLEDAEGKEALNWAAQRKEKAQKALSMYSGYAKLKQQVESILFDQRKTLFGGIVDGYVYNFWKDETHPQGVWRRTTLDEYKKPYPNWDVLIDFDILSKKMGQKIVARNFVRCKQQKNLFLIHMSFGGKDEIVFQEWDLNTRNFVENGFASKNAKGEWVGAKLVGASWIDSNQIVAATYKDKKELSNSGYATAVYLWKRGQTQAQAQSLLNIPKDHVLVSSGRILDGKNDPVVLLSDHKDFYNSTEYLWSEADGLQKVQMPSDSSFLYWFKDQVFYKLNSELNIDGRQIPAGAVVAMNWKDMLRACLHS